MKVYVSLMGLALSMFPLSHAWAKDGKCEVIRKDYQIPRGAREPSQKRAMITQTSSGPQVRTTQDAAHSYALGALGDQAGHAEESHLDVDQGDDFIQLQFETSFYQQYDYLLQGRYCVELYRKNKDQLTRDIWAIYAANDEGKFVKLHQDLNRDEFKKLVLGSQVDCPKTDLAGLTALSEKAEKAKFKACGTNAAKEFIFLESQHLSFGVKDYLNDKVDMISHPRKYFQGGAVNSFVDESVNALYEVENGYYRQDGDCWPKEKERLKLDACVDASKNNNQNTVQPTAKTTGKSTKSKPTSYEQLNAQSQEDAEHPQIHSGPMAVPENK